MFREGHYLEKGEDKRGIRPGFMKWVASRALKTGTEPAFLMGKGSSVVPVFIRFDGRFYVGPYNVILDEQHTNVTFHVGTTMYTYTQSNPRAFSLFLSSPFLNSLPYLAGNYLAGNHLVSSGLPAVLHPCGTAVRQ